MPGGKGLWRGMTAEDRFWAKVNRPDSGACWEWLGVRNRGYGFFSVNGKNVYVHRFSYELAKGSIPDGLVIDHLCRNRACVNPDHLEAVTQSENVLRGDLPRIMRSAGGYRASQTHCKYGHEFTEENTYRRPSKPHERECKKCRARIRREWLARGRARLGDRAVLAAAEKGSDDE